MQGEKMSDQGQKRPPWAQLGGWTLGGSPGCREPSWLADVRTGVDQVARQSRLAFCAVELMDWMRAVPGHEESSMTSPWDCPGVPPHLLLDQSPHSHSPVLTAASFLLDSHIFLKPVNQYLLRKWCMEDKFPKPLHS